MKVTHPVRVVCNPQLSCSFVGLSVFRHVITLWHFFCSTRGSSFVIWVNVLPPTTLSEICNRYDNFARDRTGPLRPMQFPPLRQVLAGRARFTHVGQVRRASPGKFPVAEIIRKGLPAARNGPKWERDSQNSTPSSRKGGVPNVRS